MGNFRRTLKKTTGKISKETTSMSVETKKPLK
jgi:hypothetical protein